MVVGTVPVSAFPPRSRYSSSGRPPVITPPAAPKNQLMPWAGVMPRAEGIVPERVLPPRSRMTRYVRLPWESEGKEGRKTGGRLRQRCGREAGPEAGLAGPWAGGTRTMAAGMLPVSVVERRFTGALHPWGPIAAR